MKKRACLLGIDVGTTTIKVAVFETDGRLLALHRCPTPTSRLDNGWAEHNAEDLWRSTAELARLAARDIVASHRIEGLAPASVGEAGLLVDRVGNPVSPIIAWFDRRSADQAAWWEQAVGNGRVYRISGMPIDPHFGVNKLLWIRDNYPDVFKRGAWWLSVSDWIVYRLTGVAATDYSMASRTMLFDQGSRKWSEELLAAAGLDASLFPHVQAAGTVVGMVTSEAASQTGIAEGTPVALGGHDHLCGAFVARQGQDIAVDSAGTAEVVVLPVTSYEPRSPAEAGFVYCYADVMPDRYVYSARVGFAGGLVEWLRGLIGSGDASEGEPTFDYQALSARIPQPLAFSGLVCYPTFGRVIAPGWHTDGRYGALMGLTLNHHAGHIYQAILEATCFSLRSNLDWIKTLAKVDIPALRVEGGATKNPIWMQLKADITGCAVEGVDLDEATTLGAALLAGVGVGIYPDHRDAAKQVNVPIRKWQPDPARHLVYGRVFQEVYQGILDHIGPINRALIALADEAAR